MKKKKWKDIRSAIVMMCVMLAMLSTATYAWFTIGNNATVTGLEMTAKTSSGLLVSLDQMSWANAVELRGEDEAIQSLDATTVVSDILITAKDAENNTFSSPNFNAPVYSNAYLVNGLTPMVENDSIAGKAIKKTFFIKEGSGAAAEIGIEIANISSILDDINDGVGLTNGIPNVDGSFVALKADSYTGTDAASDDAIEAVRVGFVIYNEDANGTSTTTELKIWEPNCDLGVLSTATFAENQAGTAALAPTVASSYAGNIMEKSGNDYVAVTPPTNTSASLISIPAQGSTTDGIRVDVFMWFEGQDPSCVNEIMADTIIGQLKFVQVN